MTERTHIELRPGSPPAATGRPCWPTRSTGNLKPEDEATFTAHMAACPACTALFEEARRGREWLEFLSPEPEVPEGLLDQASWRKRDRDRLPATGWFPKTILLPPRRDVPLRSGRIAGAPAWQRPGFHGLCAAVCRAAPLMTAPWRSSRSL
jgi:anti-sigma factor RsiW